jgi:serine/threonine protein kinase
MEVYKHSIVSKGVAFPYGSKIGANTRDFIEKCLKLEEEDRLSWKDLYAHPLIAKKDRGPPIKQIEVPKHVEKILMRVQESSSRKLINVKDLFVKY